MSLDQHFKRYTFLGHDPATRGVTVTVTVHGPGPRISTGVQYTGVTHIIRAVYTCQGLWAVDGWLRDNCACARGGDDPGSGGIDFYITVDELRELLDVLNDCLTPGITPFTQYARCIKAFSADPGNVPELAEDFYRFTDALAELRDALAPLPDDLDKSGDDLYYQGSW